MTKQEIKTGMRQLMAVADAIKEVGQIPAGHLYAALSQHGCSLANFNGMIELFTRKADGVEPLVIKKGDLLIWNGQCD